MSRAENSAGGIEVRHDGKLSSCHFKATEALVCTAWGPNWVSQISRNSSDKCLTQNVVNVCPALRPEATAEFPRPFLSVILNDLEEFQGKPSVWHRLPVQERTVMSHCSSEVSLKDISPCCQVQGEHLPAGDRPTEPIFRAAPSQAAGDALQCRRAVPDPFWHQRHLL